MSGGRAGGAGAAPVGADGARIVCLVPSYQAAPTLPRVVEGLRRALPEAAIVGVDDGSTDGTRAVLERLADRVVVHPVNRGKGAALRSGFAVALEMGADIVVTIDADGQHDPAAAPALVLGLRDADIVVGVRDRAGTPMPIHRRTANALSSAAISLCAGCRLPDTQSGYRAIRAEVLRRVDAGGDRYEFETAFLIRAARANFRIASVPIATIYGAPSHFRELRDTIRVIRTIWQHRPGTVR